jgi:chromosome segregation ATPase
VKRQLEETTKQREEGERKIRELAKSEEEHKKEIHELRRRLSEVSVSQMEAKREATTTPPPEDTPLKASPPEPRKAGRPPTKST